MKRMLFKAGLFAMTSAMLAAAATSCSGDNSPAASESGQIAPSVVLDTEAITSKGRAATGSDVSTADLAISLVSADGSFSQSWASPDQFPTDKNFKVGRYTLSAYYGNENSEGFEAPYYFGETEIKVEADRTASASVTASLANAMVSVDYTEAFTGYMSDYSAELAGKSVIFIKGETRPAYVKPGNVALNINVTKPNGKSATFAVANFKAAPKHHYHITVDLNEGGAGDAVLSVVFDDLLDQETVDIDLSNEVFDAPAPFFTPVALTPGEQIEILEGENPSKSLMFNLIAKGGIKNVNLTTSSASLAASGWPATIDIAAADPTQQAVLTRHGLSCKGLWKAPQQMAVIDFSGVAAAMSLVEGSDNVSTFTLSAVDLMTKVGEEISFSVKLLPVTLALTAGESPLLGENTVTVDLEYNGSDVENKVSFRCTGERGTQTPMNVLSITPAASEGHYTVVLSTPDLVSDIEMQAIYFNGRTSSVLTVAREVPDFTLSVDEIDTFAHTTVVALGCTEADPALIASKAKWYKQTDGAEFSQASATVTGAEASVSGLSAGKAYILKATVGNKSATVAVNTEAEIQLPNSGMEDWHRVNGKTKYWWVDYPGTGTDAVWGTMNLLTTSVGDGNTTMFNHKGTSYCAFSGTRNTSDVKSGSNAAIISTVGWGDNDANGSTSVGKGCKNLTVGQLYLGHYDSSSRSAVYTGISHASRPSQMRFWYKYVHKNSADYGTAEIRIRDSRGNEIAAAEVQLPSVSEYTQVTMPLSYNARAKAANILVVFKSSGNPACQTISNSNLSCPSFGNLSDGRFTGSEMYIDDIELIY